MMYFFLYVAGIIIFIIIEALFGFNSNSDYSLDEEDFDVVFKASLIWPISIIFLFGLRMFDFIIRIRNRRIQQKAKNINKKNEASLSL